MIAAESDASSPTDLTRLARWLAWAIAGVVLVQSVLAGRFLFGDADLVAVHRVVAEGVAPIALLLVWAAFATRPARRELRIGSIVLLGLVIAQTGLGFAGRDNTDIASLHLPVGVALFGVAVVIAMSARPPAGA